MLRRTHILVAGLAIALLSVGCSPVATAATSQASATNTTVPSTPCQTLATAQTILTKLSTVGTNTTVGEIKNLQQHLATAVAALNERFAGSTSQALSALNAAHDQLTSTLSTFQHLPDTTPLSQAAPNFAQIHTKVTQLQAAATNLSDQLKC